MNDPGRHAARKHTRRTFLQQAGVAGLAVASGRWATGAAAATAGRAAKVETPIRHLAIACQENRSFDHY
jgi:phospholipase C